MLLCCCGGGGVVSHGEGQRGGHCCCRRCHRGIHFLGKVRGRLRLLLGRRAGRAVIARVLLNLALYWQFGLVRHAVMLANCDCRRFRGEIVSSTRRRRPASAAATAPDSTERAQLGGWDLLLLASIFFFLPHASGADLVDNVSVQDVHLARTVMVSASGKKSDLICSLMWREGR